MRRVFIIGFALLSVFVGCARRMPQQRASRSSRNDAAVIVVAEHPTSVPTDASAAEPSLPVPQDQAVILERARQGLVTLAERGPIARDMLAFYDHYRLLAVVDGDNVRAATNAPSDGSQYFFVAADPRAVHIAPGQGGIYAQFGCHPTPTMTIHDTQTSFPLLGIMFAHEIQHARDCLIGHEPDNEPLSDEWLIGELHAHHRVSQILNEWTSGEWDRLVHRSRDARQSVLAAHGSRPESSLFGPFQEDLDDFRRLFGPMSNDDSALGFLVVQMDIDANALNVFIQSQAYGLTDDQARQHLVDMARAFYSANLPHPSSDAH